MATKAPARVYPKVVAFQAGPFTGVTDTPQPPAARLDRALLAVNCYLSTSATGRIFIGRPGFAAMGQQGAGAIQYVGQFTTTDGTERTVRILNGEIQTYNWGTDVWTIQVSAANLSGASITLSTSARIRCVVFNNGLIVTDGVNTPFSWDGTGGGGLTKLTNAPVFAGQPVVYYAKLFAIKAAERDTIVWSEEGTPDTGYEAGGYLNAWSLGGTKNEALTALAARNDSLGVIRPRSTTILTGAANDAFATTGTRSAISENIGSSSPDGVLVLDEGTVILDSDGRPQFWPNGGGYAAEPAMWEACADTIAQIPKSSLARAQITFDPETDLILMHVGSLTTDHQDRTLVFERTGGLPNFVGLWNGYDATVHGIVKDATNVPRLVHGTTSGMTYVHGTPDGALWSDNGSAIRHQLIGPALGYDTDESVDWDEITWIFYAPSGLTDLTNGYRTSRVTRDVGLVFDAPASGFVINRDVVNRDLIGGGVAEKRKRLGLQVSGRYLHPVLTHETVDEPFGVVLCRLLGFKADRFPENT